MLIYPIDVNPSGKITFFNALQFPNEAPILFTFGGIITYCNAEQSLSQSPEKLVTPVKYFNVLRFTMEVFPLK